MDNSKLPNKNLMQKSNTRTIGTNTDLNLIDSKCFKCFQENLFSKYPFFPYYFPFPFPFCNCMTFPCHQNNFTDYFNNCCKCNTKKCTNVCMPHHYVMNCSCSSSNCENCGSKLNNSENKQTLSCDSVNNAEKNVEINISRTSSEFAIRSGSSETCANSSNSRDTIEELAQVVNSAKYSEFLEKNYRNQHRSNIDFTNDEVSTSKCSNSSNNDEKVLINHLLKPNTKLKNIVDDSDDCIDSENDENTSDDDFSGKTVINISSDTTRKKSSTADDRRPTRINVNTQKRSHIKGKKTPDVEMLMMIKSLINNQYENNTPELNKLLNQLGTNKSVSHDVRQTNSPSSGKTSNINKNYSSSATKMNESNKKIL